MLTFAGSEEKQSTAFNLLGTAKQAGHIQLISNNTSLISDNISLITSDAAECGIDTCSFYSGPSDSAILSFAQQAESCGSIAYTNSGESCGSIAYADSSESCGSIASSSVSSSSCSYSC